jgi:hypothetical protein
MLFFLFIFPTLCRRGSSEGVHQGCQTQSEPGSQLSRTRQVFTFLINNAKESKNGQKNAQIIKNKEQGISLGLQLAQKLRLFKIFYLLFHLFSLNKDNY